MADSEEAVPVWRAYSKEHRYPENNMRRLPGPHLDRCSKRLRNAVCPPRRQYHDMEGLPNAIRSLEKARTQLSIQQRERSASDLIERLLLFGLWLLGSGQLVSQSYRMRL